MATCITCSNATSTPRRPFSKLGTDVTEFKVAGGKAYLAPVYDMASKEIVAWDVSRHPDMDQQKRLLAMLAERLPAGAEPILHSDMGWQYQHQGEEGARTPRHPPVHEPQGQLPGQRRHRARCSAI